MEKHLAPFVATCSGVAHALVTATAPNVFPVALASGRPPEAHATRQAPFDTSFTYSVSLQRCRDSDDGGRTCDVVTSDRREVHVPLPSGSMGPLSFFDFFDYGNGPVDASVVVRGAFTSARSDAGGRSPGSAARVCLVDLAAEVTDLAPPQSPGAPRVGGSTPALTPPCADEGTGIVPVFLSGAFQLGDADMTLLSVSLVGELSLRAAR